MVRRGAAAVVLALALALAGVACSDGDDPADDDATTATDTDDERGGTGALELEPETTTTTTPAHTALADLLLADPPEGFTTTSDEPLDLEAAVAAEQDTEAERALLETRSFERGWSRSWTNDADEVVYAAVYDFAGAQDALLYLEDGTQTLTARGADTFEVPDVEGARGFTTVEEDANGTFTAHAVAFTRGDRWFLVLVGSAGSGASPDLARQLAATQDARVEQAEAD